MRVVQRVLRYEGVLHAHDLHEEVPSYPTQPSSYIITLQCVTLERYCVCESLQWSALSDKYGNHLTAGVFSWCCFDVQYMPQDEFNSIVIFLLHNLCNSCVLTRLEICLIKPFECDTSVSFGLLYWPRANDVPSLPGRVEPSVVVAVIMTSRHIDR